MSEKVFFLTLDVEEDFGTAAMRTTYEGVTHGVPLFSRLIAELGIRATVFVTGQVAHLFSELVKDLSKDIEISSHGFYHKPLTNYDMIVNRRFITKCVEDFQEILGYRPLGFRAVDNIINGSYLKLLENAGFVYDSSIISSYPVFRSYEGYGGKAPSAPYHPSPFDARRKGNSRILEMPISSIPLINIPWAGAWLRAFRGKIYKFATLLSNPSYILIALHSWDFIDSKGRIKHSRHWSKDFLDILREVLVFLLKRDYRSLTLREGLSLYV